MKTLSFFISLCTLLLALVVPTEGQGKQQPILIGLDAAFGLANSTSASALSKGAQVAIHQINQAGGVLGGRPLELVIRDNRSIPARGIRNFEELANLENLVAVIGSRFSATVMSQAELAQEKKTLLLAAWSAANSITDRIPGPHAEPSYVFRLSLRDSLAMPVMLKHATEKGVERVGLMLLATAWGRSNERSLKDYIERTGKPTVVHTNWVHWREEDYQAKYREHLDAGAGAVIIVGNDEEVARLVDTVADYPPNKRLPVISHWGVTGGDFISQLTVADALEKVDLSLVQTFSFYTAKPAKVAEILEVTNKLFGIGRAEDIAAPVGFAHAYDLVHILARAIELAGTADRTAVRDALEQVRDYDGLVRHFPQPFTPDDHEALKAGDVFMARYRADGVIIPLSFEPGR